jgi:hypothetical protein
VRGVKEQKNKNNKTEKGPKIHKKNILKGVEQ